MPHALTTGPRNRGKANSGSSGDWTLESTTRYVYDGQRVIQERGANGGIFPAVSYTRGTDLSGSLEGAGCIGGLLGRSHAYQTGSGNWTNHNFYHADGNGNITYLVASRQTLAASYRYDPFGNTTASSGSLASANVYRFSSKEIHVNSSLYYYGYRWYSPSLQRWLNRDPIQELGGPNLYRFVANDPISRVDPFGEVGWPTWEKFKDCFRRKPKTKPQPPAPPFPCVLEKLPDGTWITNCPPPPAPPAPPPLPPETKPPKQDGCVAGSTTLAECEACCDKKYSSFVTQVQKVNCHADCQSHKW